MIGNELRDKIKKRTSLSGSKLKCPREKSDMTPCVARDGDSAMLDDLTCVGCSISIVELLDAE